MRRLGLLAPVSLCFLFAPACARDNPAFDDCETDASCVDETGAPGDGDGDPGDGDGDPGDGDGDPGEGESGDGDGDPGDGDGESGDGDGEPALPTCPDSVWVSVPVLQDTFLDGGYDQEAGCVVDWDFNLNQPKLSNNLAECPGLNFGKSTGHWACRGGSCNSAWLGKFALEEWMQMPVQVLEAGFAFTAIYKNGEPNTALAYELDVNNVNFGDCLEWHAGNGEGDPPTDCETTYVHSASPNLWGLAPNDQLMQAVPIAAANIPISADAFTVYPFVMPVAHTLVQDWLSGQTVQHGVLVSTAAWLPTEFYLYAQGSNSPPELKMRLCMP